MADQAFPPRQQIHQPGREAAMQPHPEIDGKTYRPAGKLMDMVAIVSGGDSASDDSRYMTGQVLHPNGGEIING
jgi:hypothetical protein